MTKRIVYEASLKTRAFDQGAQHVERGLARMKSGTDRFLLSWRHFQRGNYAQSLNHLGQAARVTGGHLWTMGQKGWDATQKLYRGFQSVMGVMRRVATTVGLLSGIGLGLGALTVNKAAEFESEISRVAILSGASPEQREALRAQAMKTGIRSPFGLMDTAKAEKQFAQIGFKPDEINQLVEATSLLATLGDMDMASAGEALAQVMQQFDIPTSKATETALKLAGALNATALNGNELFDAMKDAGSAAGVFKADLSEVLAIVGDLRKSLGGAEKSSIAVRNLFLVATNLAGKSDKQLDALGFSREEAQQFSFMRKPGMSLVEVIKGLAKRFGDNPEMAMKAGFEMRSILAFKKIEQTSTETFEAIKAQINDTDATMKKAEQTFELLDNKLGRVRSSADAVFIALGNRITSAFGVEGLIDGLTGKLHELQTSIEGMTDQDFMQIVDSLGAGLIHAFSVAVQFLLESFIAIAPALAKGLFDAAKGVAKGLLDSDEYSAYRAEYGGMSASDRESAAAGFIQELAGKGGRGDGSGVPGSFTEEGLSDFFVTSPSGVGAALRGSLGRTRGRRAEALLETLETGKSMSGVMQWAMGGLRNAIQNAQNNLASNPTIMATREALSRGAAAAAAKAAGGVAPMATAPDVYDLRNQGIQNIYGASSASQRAKPMRPAGRSGQEAAQR